MSNSSALATISPSLTQDEILNTAKQAFIYGFPLVVMDITKEQFTNYDQPSSEGAPINYFSNKQNFPTPDDKTVVRPNCDTFYSIAFLNLIEGPLVLNMPPTGDQYYMMPLLDAFTNVIPGSPGKRTDDFKGGKYLIVGPKYSIPTDMDTSPFVRVIHSPTNLVWALGRFQVNSTNPTDMHNNGAGKVMNLQSMLTITTIDGNPPPKGVPPHQVSTDSANDIVSNMSIGEFFARLNTLLILNPPTKEDHPAMESYAPIGVGTEFTIPFNELSFEPETMRALEALPNSIVEALTAEGNNSSSNPDYWNYDLDQAMGNYGTDYQKRAVIACIGFGANLIEDAVYYNTSEYYNADTQEGGNLDGSNDQTYTLTLDRLPPVRGFWSLTMYDAQGNLYANTINRYVVGHSTENHLQPIDPKDGPTIIYIQNESIDENDPRYNNWLPAPAGAFTLLLRAYDPTGGSIGPIISGEWAPPAVEKV